MLALKLIRNSQLNSSKIIKRTGSLFYEYNMFLISYLICAIKYFLRDFNNFHVKISTEILIFLIVIHRMVEK